MHFRKLWPFALLLMLAITAPATQAQSDNVVLTLSVPDFMQPIFNEDVLSGFTAQNPGVSVVVVPDMPDIPSPSNGLDDYLKAVQEYASKADLGWVDGRGLTPEATRAGLVLDLAPLAQGDAALNADDFYPPIWQSFQWDNGTWAIPVSANILVLTYDPSAFDRAGIAYPSDSWTMDDLADAARKLTQHGADGGVTVSGLAVFPDGLSALFRSLLGEGFYDTSALPSQPKLTNPALESLLDTWAALVEDGSATTSPGIDYDQIPIHIEGNIGFMGTTINGIERKNVLLPGGHAGIGAQGFAVSAGTPHPEQAYALARYLSQNATVAGNFFGMTPARSSLANAAPPDVQADGGFSVKRGPQSPENEALIQQALANGLPLSELRFGGYVENAARDMVANGTDAHTALQAAESQAIANLQTADSERGTVVINIATPAPTPVLGPGQVALKFAYQSNMMPVPNRDLWTQLIADFTASDPEVKQIVFDTNARSGSAGLAQSQDCFVLPYNAVPDLDLTAVLNLDPFLDADSSFDRNDVLGNTLAQLQRDNKTWGLPLDIQPQMMRYDPDQLAQAGVSAPTNGWSIDQFVDALKALKQNTGDDPPFDPRDFAGTYLLMLIADYGALPIDYRTNPPTINFTDPATVNAIRQVLDLAKSGYINYRAQAQKGVMIVVSSEDTEPPITTELFGGFTLKQGIGASEPVSALASYPTGSQYTPLSYEIGAGYISATAQNPEACYRWLSVVAQHPELFGGLPARQSLASSPAVTSTLGPNASALTATLDAEMRSPNTVVFPTPFSGGQADNFQLRFWLNRAFDNYVLHDADLETELADAQTFTTAYQQCVAQLPPLDTNTQTKQVYAQQFQDCITQADPSAAQ